MDLNDLSGAQSAVLEQAILSAFNKPALDRLLQHNDREPIDNVVAPGPFKDQVFELVQLAQREGWTDRLVTFLRDGSPDNPRIKGLLDDLNLLDIAPANRPRLVGSSLERTVKERAGFTDFNTWLDKLATLKRKVCRVEDARVSGKALGTGFLVGPDLVLTNYHVVESYIDGGADVSELACRFDFALENADISAGTVKSLAAGGAWLVDHARYSAADMSDQGGLPAENELDYALLRLEEPAGEEAGPEGKRGWIAVSTFPALPEPSDIVFIIQHPKGAPLKMAVGTVLARNANDTRIRYDTNTEAGSSGSPCFDARLDLVALHHAGDPDTGRLARFNQGIPIHQAIKLLQTRPGVPVFWR